MLDIIPRPNYNTSAFIVSIPIIDTKCSTQELLATSVRPDFSRRLAKTFQGRAEKFHVSVRERPSVLSDRVPPGRERQ